MKKFIVKCIICIICLSVGFIFAGDLSLLYLDNFTETHYQSTWAFDSFDENSEDEIIEDFLTASQESDVDFFMIDYKILSINHVIIDVYGTKGALDYLNNNQVKQGIHKSLFMGEVRVNYHLFEEIEGITHQLNSYYIGDEYSYSKMKKFKISLIDEYGGGFPKRYSDIKFAEYNLMSVWILILGFMLLLILFEVISLKKEVATRCTLGYNVYRLFWIKSSGDILILVSGIIVIPFLLSSVSDTYFLYRDILSIFLIAIIILVIINSNLLFINFKKDLSSGRSNFTMKIGMHILTGIITVTTIVTISSGIGAMNQLQDMLNQKNFFKTHSDYNYYRLNYINNGNIENPLEKTIAVTNTFYNTYYKDSLQYSYLSENFGVNYDVVMINENSFDEIAKYNEEFAGYRDDIENPGAYIIYPDYLSTASEEFKLSTFIVDAFSYDTINSNIIPISYNDSINVVAVHREPSRITSRYCENPIFILYTGRLEEQADLYYAYDIMFQISEDEYQNFLEEYSLLNQHTSKTNIMENYEYNLLITKRQFYLAFIVAILSIILLITMIYSIIELKYRLDSTELAMKKVLGYSLISRTKSFISVSLLLNLIGILISIIAKIINIIDIDYNEIAISGAMIIIIELLLILMFAHRIEKETTTHILKGAFK